MSKILSAAGFKRDSVSRNVINPTTVHRIRIQPLYDVFYAYRCKHGDTWMTLNDGIIDICDMTTSHIINSIKMLERAGQVETKAYHGLHKEFSKRNNYA